MPCPSSSTVALLLVLPLASAVGSTFVAPSDGPTRSLQLAASCDDVFAVEPESCTFPFDTFLLQVVIKVEHNSTGLGEPRAEERHVPFARGRTRSRGAEPLQRRGRVWTLSDVFQASGDEDMPGLMAVPAPPGLLAGSPPDARAARRVALSSAFQRNSSRSPPEDGLRHYRRISKRVFIILEMVPASALLGLDRLYICDGCPFESDGAGSCKSGEHCYLGFLKLLISVMAFLYSTRLIPVALIWWFVDAGFIIDNCVRGEDTINIFGMVATFDESTVEQARKLSLGAAGQFGLELALFLPAVIALMIGSRSEGLHGRIQSAIEGLRPPRGASESAIESATSTVLYQAGRADADSEDVCSICCDVFQENDRLRVLPCKHRFHAACVDMWLARNCTCPLCKGDITCGGRQQEDEPRWRSSLIQSMSTNVDMVASVFH